MMFFLVCLLAVNAITLCIFFGLLMREKRVTSSLCAHIDYLEGRLDREVERSRAYQTNPRLMRAIDEGYGPETIESLIDDFI